MASIAAWIDGAAARWSGAAYLEDAHGPRTVTYAGLRRCTRAWQRRLDDAGVPPGARVGVRLADPLGYATALVSLLGAGRVAVPLDPAAPAAEVARVLAVARPVAVVSDGPEGLPPGLPVLTGPDPHADPGPVRDGPGPARGDPGPVRGGPRAARQGSSCARAGLPGRPRGSCSANGN